MELSSHHRPQYFLIYYAKTLGFGGIFVPVLPISFKRIIPGEAAHENEGYTKPWTMHG